MAAPPPPEPIIPMDVDSVADGSAFWPPPQQPQLPLQAPHASAASTAGNSAENATLQQQLHTLQWQLLYHHATASAAATTVGPLAPMPPSAGTSFVLPSRQLEPQPHRYPYRQAQVPQLMANPDALDTQGDFPGSQSTTITAGAVASTDWATSLAAALYASGYVVPPPPPSLASATSTTGNPAIAFQNDLHFLLPSMPPPPSMSNMSLPLPPTPPPARPPVLVAWLPDSTIRSHAGLFSDTSLSTGLQPLAPRTTTTNTPTFSAFTPLGTQASASSTAALVPTSVADVDATTPGPMELDVTAASTTASRSRIADTLHIDTTNAIANTTAPPPTPDRFTAATATSSPTTAATRKLIPLHQQSSRSVSTASVSPAADAYVAAAPAAGTVVSSHYAGPSAPLCPQQQQPQQQLLRSSPPQPPQQRHSLPPPVASAPQPQPKPQPTQRRPPPSHSRLVAHKASDRRRRDALRACFDAIDAELRGTGLTTVDSAATATATATPSRPQQLKAPAPPPVAASDDDGDVDINVATADDAAADDAAAAAAAAAAGNRVQLLRLALCTVAGLRHRIDSLATRADELRCERDALLRAADTAQSAAAAQHGVARATAVSSPA
ncbi:hypothetical protein HK405_011626 [Cladochytrium tenue]|nr:hypothetical protein HK405_011626 [Cladochytrium tenue]